MIVSIIILMRSFDAGKKSEQKSGVIACALGTYTIVYDSLKSSRLCQRNPCLPNGGTTCKLPRNKANEVEGYCL